MLNDNLVLGYNERNYPRLLHILLFIIRSGGSDTMKSFKYVITDPVGIHARPAGDLVAAAKKYSSDITIKAHGKQAGAKKLIQLMGLGVKQGDEIEVIVEGADEETAASGLEAFLKDNL